MQNILNMIKKVIFHILFFTLYTSLSAQIGQPFIRNYSPEEYSGETQIWTITQDNRGIMYFGASDALYEYDGVKWNRIKVRDGVRSSAIDKNGKIYIGTSSDFGCLEPDITGKLKYTSLINLLDISERKFSIVWNIVINDNNIYFHSPEAIFKYNPKSVPKIKVIRNKEVFYNIFSIRNKIFVELETIGITELINDSIIPLKNIKFNAGIMLPYENDKYLIGSTKKGLRIYNPNAKDKNKILSKLPYFDIDEIKKTDKLIAESQLYYSIALENDEFAFATISFVKV